MDPGGVKGSDGQMESASLHHTHMDKMDTHRDVHGCTDTHIHALDVSKQGSTDTHRHTHTHSKTY